MKKHKNAREGFDIKVYGDLKGLKKSFISRLEKLYRKKVSPEEIITQDLAESVSELSHEINREIAVIINRRGQIISINVGDADSIQLGEFKNIREGQARLCGLRCIHTHPDGSSELSKADTTALELYRFDSLACIGVNPQGTFSRKRGETIKYADSITIGYLIPTRDKKGNHFQTLETKTIREVANENFQDFLVDIEHEFAQKGDVIEHELHERAVLVSLQSNELPEELAKESLAELKQLTDTAGAEVVSSVVQKKPHPDSAFYVGKGKAQEISVLVQELDANLVIIDAELSPRQQKTLEQVIGVKTIDRTELILDIFAQRAHTREGKLQVELAQMKYLYPRLVGEGLSLSRQMGGGKGGGIATRGPGETKLEIDRRRIRERIKNLENEVNQIKRHRSNQRKLRQRNRLSNVAIVGYTNAGKSTLLNALSNADILAEDKLFATLDPTTRKIRMSDGNEVLITDTVGFIQRLPTSLVKAFRATLEEVTEADVILHVIDPNHSACMQHIDTVLETLESLDAGDKPIITAINKIDLLKNSEIPADIEEKLFNIVKISALQKTGFSELLDKIKENLPMSYSY